MGLEHIIPIRRKTYFGSGAHTQCSCNVRGTTRRCSNPAVKGTTVCRAHGGTGVRNRRDKTIGKGCQPEKQYHASVALTADLSDVVSKYPRAVAEALGEKWLGARGRALHALAQRKLNHTEEEE